MKCIQCNKGQRLQGRRYCKECYLIRKRKLQRIRYRKVGRTKYTIICFACNKYYDKADRKEAKFCPECWNERQQFISKYKSTNHYKNQEHKEIAEKVLNKKLNYNEVVHHLDHNPQNNNLDNLIMLSRSIHVALHNFLYDEEFRLYKQHGDDYIKFFDIKKMTKHFFDNRKYKPIFLNEQE